jgi:hypothetical protein
MKKSEQLDEQLSNLLSGVDLKTQEVPEAFKTFLKNVPLRIKLRSVLKQNDVQNWINGEYKGDLNQLENTVQALEVIINDHFVNEKTI